MALFGDGDRRELEKKAKAEGRLPPGQSLTLKWPVLHYGSIPAFDAAKWDFKISGQVEQPLRLTWEEFRALPRESVTSANGTPRASSSPANASAGNTCPPVPPVARTTGPCRRRGSAITPPP